MIIEINKNILTRILIEDNKITACIKKASLVCQDCPFYKLCKAKGGDIMVKTTLTTETKYEGYCMKCKDKRVIKDAVLQKMKKTGAPCVKGKCVKCDTNMFKILPKDK